MYTFEISKSGWLSTHSNENQLRINLNNVSRIQTWVSSRDTVISGSAESYIIAFELTNKGEVPKTSMLIDAVKFEEAFWGFENIFTLVYLREDAWLNAILQIDQYLNSK